MSETVVIGILKYGEGNLGEIFRSGHDIEYHGFVPVNCCQKINHHLVTAMDQKSMVPDINKLFFGSCFDIAEIHHHAVVGRTLIVNEVARQSDLDGIAVAVHVATLPLVIRQSMAGVKFESAGDGDGGIHAASYR